MAGLRLGHGASAGLVSGAPRFLGGRWSGWSSCSGDQWRADLGKPVEGVGELMPPGPTIVDSDSGSALPAYEAGGDVQQPVAQHLGLGLGQVVVSRVVWVQAIRSAAVNASCSQVWLIGKSREGKRPIPVCLRFLILSSTRAWARCRASSQAS